MCSSTCNTCTANNDPSSCSGCSSTLTSLDYDPLLAPSQCAMTSTNNAQLLTTIDANTLIGSSYLTNVTFNSIVYNTPTNALSSLLYKNNILDFMNLSNNTVIFSFDGLPIHKKLLIRGRVKTSCPN